MVRLLKIERPARLNLGRRIVPSLLVAVTRRRRPLDRLRAAKRTLEVDVLLCRPDLRAARLARRSRAAGFATHPGGRSRNELPDDRRKSEKKPTEIDMGRIHGSPKPLRDSTPAGSYETSFHANFLPSQRTLWVHLDSGHRPRPDGWPELTGHQANPRPSGTVPVSCTSTAAPAG